MIMGLTEAQKKISTSQKFWDNLERGKKQVELWQKQPMTPEEFRETMANRKAFLKKNSLRISK